MSYPLSVVNLNPVGYQSALKELGVSRTDDYDIYQPLHFAKPYTVPDWNSEPAAYDYRFIQKWYGATIQELAAAAQRDGFRYVITQTYHP